MTRVTGVDPSVDRHEPPRWLAAGDFVYRQPPIPVVTGSAGCILTDTAGRRILDAEAANGSAILGYDAKILDEAMERVRHLPAAPSFIETSLRIDVGERLCALIDETCETRGRIAMELGGAQGIELAMKIVRATGRTGRVVTFEGGYHGRSPFTSQLSASERYRTISGSTIPVTRFPYPDCEQCRFGRIRATCGHECVSFVDRSFSMDLAGLTGSTSGVSAVVVEPVLNVGGMALPDSRYLEALINACRGQGALLVVDEIFAGLYRMGTRWGFEQHELVPDIVIFSKAITNGLTPLSCVWGREDVIGPAVWQPGSHSSTFAANPFALAVADVVLGRLMNEHWRRVALRRVENGLHSIVDGLAATFPDIVATTWVRGAVARILLRGPYATTLRTRSVTIADDDPEDGFHGVLVASTGMAPNVIALHPPYTMTAEQLETVGRLLMNAFFALRRELGSEVESSERAGQ